MTRRWQITALLTACFLGGLIGVAGMSLLSHGTSSAPPVASPARAVSLAPAAAEGGPTRSTDALIKSAQHLARLQPSSSTFTNLALAYMQKERETNDVAYYNLADQALAAARRFDPRNADVIGDQAWVAMGRHDFALARQLAVRAIALNPADPSGYGTLGDAQANLGDYNGMVRSYQKMVNLKPSLASYNRASYARWLFGDIRGATRYMLMAIRAGSTIPENVAWCESQLGDDYFNDGFVIGAKQMYQLALRTFPRYPRALAGMAAVEAALGQSRAAIRDYQRAIAIVPLPQYLTSLGDLYASMGKQAAAEREYAVIRFIDRIYMANHVRVGVETAAFDADHNRDLTTALKLVRSEARSRNDIQTMDTLAWVLYKNGRYGEAWQAEKQAMRLGTHFAPYYFHAGLIQEKLGKLVEAQSYLQAALMLNPHFSTLQAPVAVQALHRVNALVNRPPAAGGH